MSDETQITPITQPQPAVAAARDVVPKEAQNSPPPPPTTDAAKNTDAAAASDAPEKTQSAPVFGLSLQFDADTHRLIIEARNPLSGAVVFQVPSKSALQALTDSGKSAEQRGKSVNNEA